MLSDALFLDPWRDTREVWISARSDQAGSGTQEDPFSGATRPTPSISVTLSRPDANKPYEVQAITGNSLLDPPHSYIAGDIVEISGATDPAYNGRFAIDAVTGFNSFKFTVRDKPLVDSGGITCFKIIYLFDQIMRALPANSSVHIGPGVFETRGEAPGLTSTLVIQPPHGWRPLSGCRILGSGMGATTLKLVGGYVRNLHYAAIGTDYFQYLDGFELSDLTIDCNVEGQAGSYVASGAVTILGGGRNILIRRVRAIHFGTQAPDFYVENFVLFVVGTHPLYESVNGETAGVVVADCICEQPAHNNYWNSSIIVVGGTEDFYGDGVYTQARGCVIRNNYVNCQYDYGPKVPINSITGPDAQGVVTVTTRVPHQKTAPGNILVSGVTVGNNGDFANSFNGVFAIDSVVSPTQLKYRINNSNPGTPAGGTLGGRNTSHPTGIVSIAIVDSDPNHPKIRITTQEPHFRTTNNNVYVLGVLTSTLLPVPEYNGVFPVVAYDPANPNQLVCELKPLESLPDPATLNYDGAEANVPYQALVAEPGTSAVVEGNRIMHCKIGGPYQDTYSSRDIIVRHNYYHDVVVGPQENRTQVSTYEAGIPLTSLMPLPSDNTIAVATTSLPHGLTTNDRVTILGDNSPDADDYNTQPGSPPFITSVPSPITFHYNANGSLGGPASNARYQIAERLRTLESLTKSSTGPPWLITAVMASIGGSQKHGLEKGDAVIIRHAAQWDTDHFVAGSKYIANWAVTAATEADFQFVMDTDPGIDSGTNDFAAGYFGRIWQVKRLTIEDNVVDLAIRKITALNGRSIGIFVFAEDKYAPQSLTRQVVIRGNIIRNTDNDSDPAQNARGMEVYVTEKALLLDNIIRVDLSTPIRFETTTTVRTFNNLTPSGQVLEATAQGPSSNPALDVGTLLREDLELPVIFRSRRSTRG